MPIPSSAEPARDGAGATVELLDLMRDFGAGAGLNGLSLQVQPGEFVALLGPSGCGKSTALRALAGLERIDSGRILIDRIDVGAQPTSTRDIGMVFQAYSLFPHLTALKNVEFGLRMRKIAAAERRDRAREALALVGLQTQAQKHPHQLSGGQQQRVALARALVVRPRVLLLDEPLSALDAKVRIQLRDEIKRIQAGLGITTIFVTHDQEEALAVADRVAVMRAGALEQIGTPEQLYREPESAFVAEFVGLSTRVDAVVRDGSVEVLGTALPPLRPMPDGEVVAYLRPESLSLSATGAAAQVLSTSFLGAIRRTTAALDDGTHLVVQHAASDTIRAGDRVCIAVAPTPVAVGPRPR